MTQVLTVIGLALGLLCGLVPLLWLRHARDPVRRTDGKARRPPP